MGYVLVWVEHLAASLLLTATLLACLGRIPWRWVSRPLAVVAFLVPLAVYNILIAWAEYLRSECSVLIGVLNPLRALAVCYALGGVWLLWRGLRGDTDSPVSIRAGHWPIGRLTAALSVVLVLHAMTLWSLDAAVKQQLTAVRAEAGALAYSVAPLRVPDSENAARIYQPAFEAMHTDTWPPVWEQATDALEQPPAPPADFPADLVPERGEPHAAFDFSSDDLGEFLDRHAGEMAVIRKAAALPDCRFERDYGRPSFEMLLPEQVKLRDAARLLAIDARHRAAGGDARGALENVNSIFQMARHAASEPLVVSALVSMAINVVGASTLEAVLMSTPAGVRELDILDLKNGISYRRCLARAYHWEEATGLSLFCCVERTQLSADVFDFVELDGFLDTPGLPALYRIFHLAEDLDSYRRLFRRVHMASVEPYHLNRGDWQDLEDLLQREKAGILTLTIFPALWQPIEVAQRADALKRAATLGVAVYRHHAQHDRFPENLDELSPEYVDIIPPDPFDGQPMRLRHADENCVIYSVGRNLVDDDGSPLDWQKRTGDVRFAAAPPVKTNDKAPPKSGEARND